MCSMLFPEGLVFKWSIGQWWLVVIASILISLWEFRVLTQRPLDVFPSFAPPQVEIQTEAPVLAPEEVDSLVTRPIERVTEAAEKVNFNAPSGFLINSDQELLIRGAGCIESIDQLKQSAITAVKGALRDGIIYRWLFNGSVEMRVSVLFSIVPQLAITWLWQQG